MSYNLYLFSDATGETAERVVRAALSQFQGVDLKLYKFSNLRTRAAIVEAVGVAASHPGLVLYTMVDPELTEFLRSEVEANGLEGVDLMSLLIYKFAEIFGIPPQTNWYPEDYRFVLLVLVLGTVVVTLAILGFKKLAQFAEVCSIWMFFMFIAGALALLPALMAKEGLESLRTIGDFWRLADKYIWTGTAPAGRTASTRSTTRRSPGPLSSTSTAGSAAAMSRHPAPSRVSPTAPPNGPARC